MAVKDILVQLDASPASERRMAFACALAAKHGAHLTGLFVVDTTSAGTMLIGDDIGAIRVIEQYREQALADAATVEAAFRAQATQDRIQFEWALEEGNAPDVVTHLARNADLTILGQTDPENTAVTANGIIMEHVLFGSGRPVLMVPYAGKLGDIGQNVLIGWTPRRESARALNDALQLMAPGSRATVAAVVRSGEEAEPRGVLTEDITRHLARHGITAEGHELVAPDLDPGNVLLNTASDMNADLLVIGAYGHSRLREMVLGGVTRSLLQQAPVPVLMSH